MSRAAKKNFDAVATMRKIRDRASQQFEGLSAQEQRERISACVASDPKLSRLLDKAAQHELAADDATRRS